MVKRASSEKQGLGIMQHRDKAARINSTAITAEIVQLGRNMLCYGSLNTLKINGVFRKYVALVKGLRIHVRQELTALFVDQWYCRRHQKKLRAPSRI